MTTEADLTTALKTVTARVFPDFAPTGTVLPYITYTQVGGDAVGFLERVPPSKKNGTYQVNVWAATRATAASLILLVEQAMVTSILFQADATRAPINEFDSDVPIYGAHQDFSIWSDR